MKNKFFGYELRSGVETLAHKVCLALNLPPVNLSWVDWTTTAAINGHGDMVIANIADDAVVPASTFKRYCGFVVHELCHRDRKSTRLNSSHSQQSRMPSSA